MRLSQFPIHTTKETPADAEVVSHQLMLRAGYALLYSCLYYMNLEHYMASAYY